MSVLSIVLLALVVILLVGAVAGAWYHDYRLERFRANLRTGQLVTYFRLYYSRTEEDAEYGNGIICRFDEHEVVVIRPDMSKITVRRTDLYPV